jgi:hypothetical protein
MSCFVTHTTKRSMWKESLHVSRGFRAFFPGCVALWRQVGAQFASLSQLCICYKDC